MGTSQKQRRILEVNETGSESDAKPPTSPLIKIAVLVVLVGGLAYVYSEYRSELTLQSLAEHEAGIRQFHRNHPVGVLAVAFLIYVAVTALSIPGAVVLTLAYGWVFKEFYGQSTGLAAGVVLISFASTAGATLAFLLSRYLLRDSIQKRFGDRLKKFDETLQKEGPFYLFTLRLIPAVPFWVINVVMGLTPIRVWTYWWVSQLGMLAGTCVYVYAGTQIPSATDLAEHGLSGILTPGLLIAFVILGLFPIVVKKAIARFTTQPSPEEIPAGEHHD